MANEQDSFQQLLVVALRPQGVVIRDFVLSPLKAALLLCK
jgi:hypothetical protein